MLIARGTEIKKDYENLAKRDMKTITHSENVGIICSEMAEFLGEKATFTKYEAYIAGCLHDIGKINFSDEVLKGSKRITCINGRKEIEIHAQKSGELLKQYGFSEKIILAVRHHHERWDGSGYPDNLQQEEISPLANLIGIIDSFDAIRDERPYKKGKTIEETIEIMKQEHYLFNPDLFQSFLQYVEIKHGVERKIG